MMKRDDRRRHHRKLRVLLGHLVNRSIGALNGELHQVFDVSAVGLVTKRFIENFDRRLRRDFTCFCAADAVCYSEDRALRIVQKGVFIQRATFVQAAIR